MLNIARPHKAIAILVIGWGYLVWTGVNSYYGNLSNDLYTAVIARSQTSDTVFEIDASQHLQEILKFNTEKEWAFVVIFALGGLLIFFTTLSVSYIRTVRRTSSDIRLAASAFEAQDGMIITDCNNNILRVNKAFTNITGYTSEEVVGKNTRILNSGYHDEHFYAVIWAALSEIGYWSGEVINRRKNGEIFPEMLTISPVKDSDGMLINYVATIIDLTASKAAENEINNLAFYDPLTLLPNRRLLRDRLNQALHSSTRTGCSGALLLIDLDNFKTINDTLGHLVGDMLLKNVADRLVKCVREGDTVSRLGGDEFVVLLEGLNHENSESATQAEVVGEKIIEVLNRPYKLKDQVHHNTPSIGITIFNNHLVETDELFKQADIAMYQAKKAGRNTLRFFDTEMQDSVNARAEMEEDLRKALGNNEFHLYYQIQVDSEQNAIGAESLLRWDHPVRGFVSPALFIPLLEETGLILAIGAWVLETACSQLEAWKTDEDTQHLVLAVNISAKQFRHPNFVSQVTSAIERHALNPSLLKLELTESLLLENFEFIVSSMNALNRIGIKFSLDDFGTGYSSLQYLKRLPLDQLKIDQSFVRDLVHDNSDQAIVRTIIAMANSLNLDIIAEGVESMEQHQLLMKKGCFSFQGFLFGRPVPIGDFGSLLKEMRSAI
jgi:diguanylate cyclase (GGDEF)-like protein/PAS domain S-box-containing protein